MKLTIQHAQDPHPVSLYYETMGEGEPLLLLAGMASDMASWAPMAAQLSADYQLILVDNRCAGRTEPSPCAISRDLMVADCIALLDHLQIERSHILGHSLGGLIALQLATKHPQYAHRVIALACGTGVSQARYQLFNELATLRDNAAVSTEQWFTLFFHWLFNETFFDNRDAIAAAATMAARHPYLQSPAAFRSQVDAMQTFFDTVDTTAIESRVLVLGGSDDLLNPVAALRRTWQAVPHADWLEIANAGHAIHWDQPDAVVHAITQFLQQP